MQGACDRGNHPWWGLFIRHKYVQITTELRAYAKLHSAYQVHLALVAFSKLHDGHFPPAEHTSNEAFRELFKAGLVDDERRFFLEGSAWHGGAAAPDGKIGDKEDGFAKAVGPGENHWAYTSGLNAKTSDPSIPLFMDGFTDVIGTWCAWYGSVAMVRATTE